MSSKNTKKNSTASSDSSQSVLPNSPIVVHSILEKDPNAETIRNATIAQALLAFVLVGVTIYYACETHKIRKESSVSAKANSDMAIANQEMSRINQEMSRTAEKNLKVSQDMLESARDSISEMKIARREQMRPYLAYQAHSFYREGIGRHYMVWLTNEGLTPAKDITMVPSDSEAPVSKSISFLGPRQKSLIVWTRSDQMQEKKIPKSFTLAIKYQGIDEVFYQQNVPVELADEDPNSLGAIREQLFKLNGTIDDIYNLQRSESMRVAQEKRSFN